MTQPTKRRIGRKRWGELVRFLTDRMKNASSERVQMVAAQRLADILTLREEREQLELRRELRSLAKAGNEPSEETTPTPVREVRETAEEFLARIKAEQHEHVEDQGKDE